MYAGYQSQSVSDVEDNYDWTLTTDWYEDIFIDPALVNRSIGYGTMYITLKSNASFSNVTIDTSYGDTSTTGIFTQLDDEQHLNYYLVRMRKK